MDVISGEIEMVKFIPRGGIPGAPRAKEKRALWELPACGMLCVWPQGRVGRRQVETGNGTGEPEPDRCVVQ